MCGTRDTMEDKMVIKGEFRNSQHEDFFAVFDGHSGSSAALYAAKVNIFFFFFFMKIRKFFNFFFCSFLRFSFVSFALIHSFLSYFF